MKKYFYAILLIVSILLILTGCGQKNADQSKSEINKKETVTEDSSFQASDLQTNKNENENETNDSESIKTNNFSDKGSINQSSEYLSASKQQQKDNKKGFYSPFSGKPVQKLKLQKAVMASIENTPQARPQSGLEQASIVYEFLVEGGITRFMALYWDKIPAKIGPIRSLRPYMIETAHRYNSLILHAGASPQGFAMLSDKHVTNLDQIYNGNYYWRSSERKKPHNLYTGNFKIDKYLNNLTGQEYDPRFSFKQVTFINPEDEAAERIIINYWGNYKVCYKYNPDKNNYKRYLNDFGNPHLTAEGKQIEVDNIVVQHASTEVIDDVGRLNINISGEGKALIFRDGVVIKGNWEQSGTEHVHFYNSKGERVKLNPGKTWIQVIPDSSTVTYEKTTVNTKKADESAKENKKISDGKSKKSNNIKGNQANDKNIVPVNGIEDVKNHNKINSKSDQDE